MTSECNWVSVNISECNSRPRPTGCVYCSGLTRSLPYRVNTYAYRTRVAEVETQRRFSGFIDGLSRFHKGVCISVYESVSGECITFSYYGLRVRSFPTNFRVCSSRISAHWLSCDADSDIEQLPPPPSPQCQPAAAARMAQKAKSLRGYKVGLASIKSCAIFCHCGVDIRACDILVTFSVTKYAVSYGK